MKFRKNQRKKKQLKIKMVLGTRKVESAVLGARGHGGKLHGTRHHVGPSGDKKMKTSLEKGVEMLMNRSVMKGIVDPVERSVALGADVSKKMASLETATGKNIMSLLDTLGKRA
jgi:hypothetical protein